MTGVHVALLRGVNVGSARRVAMPALRTELERRGAQDVRTYLQSGNAVFTGGEDDPAGLVREALAALGVDGDVLVREGPDLAALVARNPWPERVDEPTKLNVGFLSAPGEGTVTRAGPEEEVRFDGSEVWLWYGAGQGRSRLALDVGDRIVTVRNWRTVTALAELAAAT